MFDTHTIARTGVIVGALVSIVVAVVLNLTAEDVFPRQDDGLFQARTIECRWVEGTSADWDNGELSTEDGPFGEDAQIIFDEIDLQARTTRIGGQISPVIQTAEGITFIEPPRWRTLTSTRCFDGPSCRNSTWRSPLDTWPSTALSRPSTTGAARLFSSFVLHALLGFAILCFSIAVGLSIWNYLQDDTLKAIYWLAVTVIAWGWGRLPG